MSFTASSCGSCPSPSTVAAAFELDDLSDLLAATRVHSGGARLPSMSPAEVWNGTLSSLPEPGVSPPSSR
eukprot:3237585-Pyramimonas_sp.AAC.1